MSVDVATGKHIPKDSMFFEFDNEVIAVFDNMAKRSIPGYDDAYRLLGGITSRMDLPRHTGVWDFGTTTGKGLKTVHQSRHLDPYLDYWGCDISEDAVVRTKEVCSDFAQVLKHDLREGIPENATDISVAIYAWTLQFMNSHAARENCLRQTYDAMVPGGACFVMEKYNYEDTFLNSVCQDAYIEFRRSNGYTLEEIKAKSAALGNSMWPVDPATTREWLRDAGFKSDNIHIMYRRLNFGGFVAFK